MRNFEIKDKKFEEVMNQLSPINPLQSLESRPKNQAKLIYISLGTVFNNNMSIFEAIIEAIEKLGMSKNELKVILSVGDHVYMEFQEKFKNENYRLAENFVIQPWVPQIEVLKRASLFLTHVGMNSCSEAVHYAVPIICIPLSADQPFNAKRMVDLQLGKEVYPLKISVDELCHAIGKF